MLRPPRSKGRFQGDATTLSNPYADTDGYRRRRRYAVYAAMATILITGIVAAVKGGKKNGKSGGSAPLKAPKDAYKLLSEYDLPELKAKIKLMEHTTSGMPILTVVPEDASQDAVFGMSFRTLLSDHSGIAYVVQKCIQDGSENYPVKDPFNQLDRGSLRTHMESFVEKDRTGFIYASRNQVDFRNGVRVYLDGIFKPNFIKDGFNWIYRQEAWRLIPVGKTDIGLAGNAFNEAKEAQMNPTVVHEDYLFGKLFDGHPYSFKQKGDFGDVVTLTRTKVKNFYNKFYHPSNGKAFCFGPQAFVDECMDLMNPYLAEYKKSDKARKASDVGWNPMSEIKSIKESVPYPSFEDTNDFRAAISYVINDQPLDARTELAWHIITDLLLGSSSATIQRVVADNDLGDDATGGLHSQLRQWILTVGVSGVPSVDKVEEARIRLQQTIWTAASEGFSDEALKGTLNKLDMQFREQSSNGVPRGAKMFKDVLTRWNYDESPLQVLSYSKAFAALKKEIEKEGQGVLLQLMTRHMVDNKHALTTQLYPSTNLLVDYTNKELNWLENLNDAYPVETIKVFLEETNDLVEIRSESDSEEVLESISHLTVTDLRAMNFEIATKVYDDVMDSGMTMLEHEVPHSNGIAYIDFAMDISNMDFDDVVLLPLFCRLLVQGGTHLDPGIQLQQKIDAYTGGLTIEPIVEEIVSIGTDGGYLVPDGTHMETKVVVRTSCLAATGCIEMFALIKGLLYSSTLDDQDLAIDILKKMIDDMEDDMQINSSKYTALRVQSQYGLPGFVREQWQGITQLLNLRRALRQAKNDWSTLSSRLVVMGDAMRRGHRSGMTFSLTADKVAIKAIAPGIRSFVKEILPLPTQSTAFPDFGTTEHPWFSKGEKRMEDEVTAEAQNEAFLTATRLNSVAKGGRLYERGEAVRGYDLVVLQYIGGYYLFNELRFGAGAADAKAVLDIDTGSVVYLSSQDPNIAYTLDVYDEGVNFVLRELDHDSDLPPEVEGAIIGTIAQLDGTALQPSQIGYISLIQYLKQDTPASRQKFREEILGATVRQLLSMADNLGAWGKPTIAVVTNAALYDIAVEGGITLVTCNITGFSC